MPIIPQPKIPEQIPLIQLEIKIIVQRARQPLSLPS